jgi:hypothetical protein
MKMPAFSPRLAASLTLLSAIAASGQLIEAPPSIAANSKAPESLASASFAADRHLSGTYQLPTVRKSKADITETSPVFASQDALTLGLLHGTPRKVESIIDLSILQETSAYRSADRIKLKVSDEQATGIQAGLAELSAAYQKPGQTSESADCESVSLSVEQRIKMDSSNVLEILESEVAANPNCACEIIKTTIMASEADVSLVADIVEVAITVAPESMRMISQCAIAAMPESLSAVQAVLARLDPNSGDSSGSSKGSKSGKDAKAAIFSTPPPESPNPLDRLPPLPPLPPPPQPPPVTNPDPSPYYDRHDGHYTS